jgi:serine/threonine-protein kinase
MEDMVFGRRYRVTERIGTGGMADVYKAIDETLGRTVAVKVMHARYADDPDFIQRFRHEASSAANLSHPSIVNIYDYGVEGGTYYIVMEFVRGTDLKAIVRRQGALDPIKVAEYGAQACAALSVAHGYGIIHRDIKPQNIVLMPDGGIKIMDFGIARAVDSDSTQTGSVLGTAQYVSPEQAQGRKLGPESDLYSLGVVLYELATGRLPFEGDTPVSVALRHVNDIAPSPRSVNPAIPPALEAVILKAMKKDPAERYRSAEEMREDLLRVVGGRAVAAAPGVGDTTVMPVVGRGSAPASIERVDTGRGGVNPWVWVALVVGAILFGLGGAWALGAFNGGPHVPVTSGMTLEVAKQAIIDAGLTVGAESNAADPAVPAGQVLSTNPPAGTAATRGQAIDIVVSTGPEMVDVPSVVGSGEATAVISLQEAGFAVDPRIGREINADYPYGTVFRTDPAPGTPAIKGSQVRIWVSEGPKMVTVPTVVGKSQADAKTALEDAAFKVKVTKRADASAAVGSVIEQKPVGATQAPEGSTVTIFVSTGPEQVSVPALIGLTQAEAVAKIQAMGLLESVLFVNEPDPAKTGFVQDQDPAVGQKINKGATVTIWVAKVP